MLNYIWKKIIKLLQIQGTKGHEFLKFEFQVKKNKSKIVKK